LEASDSPAVVVTSSSDSTVIIDDQSSSSTIQGESTSSPDASVAPSNSADSSVVQNASSDVSSASEAPILASADTTVADNVQTINTFTAPVASGLSQGEPSQSLGAQPTYIAPLSLRENLASTKFSSYSMPFIESVTSMTQSADNSSPITPVLPANIPVKAPLPVQPFGMMSALLALFSEAVPAISVHTIVLGVTGFTTLLIVLTMVALAVSMTARTTVVSYGTWLKQTGFTSVARSGLPAFSSSFAIPSMMGYVCAPAPYA
jgi:hypothetical protein